MCFVQFWASYFREDQLEDFRWELLKCCEMQHTRKVQGKAKKSISRWVKRGNSQVRQGLGGAGDQYPIAGKGLQVKLRKVVLASGKVRVVQP